MNCVSRFPGLSKISKWLFLNHLATYYSLMIMESELQNNSILEIAVEISADFLWISKIYESD